MNVSIRHMLVRMKRRIRKSIYRLISESYYQFYDCPVFHDYHDEIAVCFGLAVGYFHLLTKTLSLFI